MRFLIVGVFCLVLMASFVDASPATNQVAAVVATTENIDRPTKIIEAPVLSATAYGVFSLETGELVLGDDTEKVLPIASVTKLFTAATALQAENLEEEIVITAADVATEGRAGKLEVGQTYSTHELLFPLLLESSNDAASALERNYGPILLANDDLADASGLSSSNQASVETLAKEVMNLYQNFPHLFDITKLSQYVGEDTVWVNNSPVKDTAGYRGGKHGYTEAANHTLVAIFAEESLDNQEFIYVILGSDDLVGDMQKLREAIGE